MKIFIADFNAESRAVLGEHMKRCGAEVIEASNGEEAVQEILRTDPDVAFVDANHTYEASLKYFDVLAQKVHEKSVVVMDDIHHSEEMERAWREICADERVTSTIDLYQMGLVFFDQHYWKRNYRMRL